MTDLCTIKQNTSAENIFADSVFKASVLNYHKENCIEINGQQAVKMPSKNIKIKFENFHKQLAVPFDFEAITEKFYGCLPNNGDSFTETYQKHTDCGYGYKLVCCYDDKYSKPIKTFRGENAVFNFMEKMLEEVDYGNQMNEKHFNKKNYDRG